MFRLNDTGFQMDLPNGYTISVMFSPSHACSNRHYEKEYKAQLLDKRIADSLVMGDFSESPNAETAVRDTVTGKFIPITRKLIDSKTKETYVYTEDAQGYQNVNALIHLINEVRDYTNTDSKVEENRMNSINKRKAMSNA